MYSDSHWHGEAARPRGTAVYRTFHDFSGDQRLTTSVLLALDAVPGIEMDDADDTLFASVDPDALDALFEPTSRAERATGRVSFTIGGYEVAIAGDGEIVVRPPSTQPE